MYSAVFIPALMAHRTDPATKHGFATEMEAEEYIFSQMCSACQEARTRWLRGERVLDDEGGDDQYRCAEYPSCFDEWMIGATDAFVNAKSWGEREKALGLKVFSTPWSAPED